MSAGADPTGALVVGTITVVGLGTAITAKKVNAKAIVAGGILALFLSALANADEKLARGFAGLIFLGACYQYLPDVVEALGYGRGGSGRDIELDKARARESEVRGRKEAAAAPAAYPAPADPTQQEVWTA
ncbi:hypothetical protein ACWCPQ_34265 [Nocardia sp. NPDC001965]